MDQRLLLVDSSIQNYESIVAAAQETVTVVVFDRNVDTHESILHKIAEKNVAKFSLMGLVQHGDASAPDYRIVNAATPGLLSEALEENATMPSWNEIFEFMVALKTTYGIELIDLISCSLYSRPEWVTILNQMERLTNIQFRASSDPTGNLANGGNWVMESDNVNIQDVYFTEAIAEFQGLLIWQTFFRKNMDMVTATNKVSVPMVSASNPVNGMIRYAVPCSIVGWGDAINGGTATGITNVVAVASTARAFAGIRSDGTVVAWGLSTQGGSVSGVTGLANVRHIASTDNAFAALTSTGAVVAWGDSARGGNASSVSASLTSGVVAIASTGWAFAALKSNGTVVVWGDATNGGNSASVSSLTGVVSIASTGTAFAALRSDGTVFAWGASGSGGSTSGVTGLSNVSLIASNDVAFAALKNDGSVVAWGSSTQGGSITGLTGVVGIASSTWAFAALKSNSDVVAWGDAANGGSVSELTDVVGIASNALAFAAITRTGSVRTWGSSVNGGGTTGISDVSTIASTGASFAGIRTLNNQIVAWGNSADGGTTPPSLRDVTAVYATNFAFAAVKSDNTVVAWGGSTTGGNASAVSASLVNVVAIASNYFAFAALSQPAGSLDTTFDTTIKGASNTVNSIAVQNDGKLIIGGTFTSYSGTVINRVARLNADGTLDTSFSGGSGPNNTVTSVAVQSDGKILIGGNFTTYNGTVRNNIARLNADGSLDTTFNLGTGASTTVTSITVQSDGKILIGGGFTTYNGTARNRIARLNADGTLDTSFTVGAGADFTVRSIAVQSDGKIIIGGDFTTYNGTARNRIARLNANGTLDTSFLNFGAGASSAVRSIAIQSDGKILIGGDFTTYNGTARNYIARLNADGSLDTTFTVGTGAELTVYSIAIQSDGKILIGGEFATYNGTARNRIARLNADGSLDTTFTIGGGTNTLVRSIAVQSDGKIVIGGDFTTYNGTARNRIARLNADGTLDTSFTVGIGANNLVYSIAIQSDGKILIGGDFTNYGGLSRNRIARLNADGTLDTSFTVGIGANNLVYSIAIQSDGKVLIGGNFSTYDGTAQSRIARLNADGSLDTTFTVGAGAGSAVLSVAVQSDGKILIGGTFMTYNGTTQNRIARLNANGTLDTSFTVGTGADLTVYSIAIQSDGKVLIGGEFTTYNGTARTRIARLNADGSLDTTFTIGGGTNTSVRSIAVQSDGKIVIGGDFTTYNGTARNCIARLNANGSLDTSFADGIGANNLVYSIAIQSDGKVLIGGNFTTYDGTAQSRIARLNANGSLDTTFLNAVGGANNFVQSVTIQSDGKIIIGGLFTNYTGIGVLYIARLTIMAGTTSGAPTAVTATAGSSQASVSWTAPASDGGSVITSYTVTSSPGGFTATSSTTTATITGLAAGTAYTFTVRATNAAGTGAASTASNSVTPYTTPGAPTAVTATAGASQASVSWTAPVSNGFSAITSYTVTSSPGGFTATTATTTAILTGLTPGTAYTFTVRASNAGGLGTASSASNSVTPYTTPGAPTAVAATAGPSQASVSWTAPASNGFSPITLYTVTASPDGFTATSATTSATMTGLTAGTAYTFTVTATNAAGTSTASAASAAVTPTGAPGTPTGITATPTGAGEVTVSWTPPANTGGSPITSYIVSSSTGDYTTTVSGDQTTAVVTGMETGASYTFSVVAVNAVSPGSTSTPSSSVFLITSPVGPVAVGLNASARVTWTLTSGDRSANTGYTVTSTPGSFTATVSGANTAEATVTGLTNGVSYIFTVVANTTSYGSSPTSVSTNAVTPNTVNIITAINESSTSQTSVADYIVTQGSRPASDVLLEAKCGVIIEQDGLTLEQRTSVSVQYIESLRTTFNTDTITVASVKSLGTTFTARSDTLVDAPVVVFLPAYVAETAVVDLTNFDRNNKYVQIELPPTYSVVLTEGPISKTLTYDGTTIALDGTPVGVDGKFRIGTTYEYTLAGIGSFLLLATPIVRRVIGNGIRIIAHNFRMF